MSIATPSIRVSAALSAESRAAAASGDPAHRAIGKNDAEFGLIIAAIRDRALDGDLAQCAVVRMDASSQRGVIDGGVRLETEESFVLDPDLVTTRSHSHSANCALSAARLIRASLMRNASFERLSSSMAADEQYEWSRGHQDEQLQGQRVFLGGLRQERTVPKHRSYDSHDRDDQD